MDGMGFSSPVHVGYAIPPLLFPFPVASLAAALATDVLYWITSASMWAGACLWLLGASVVALPIAAMAGFANSVRREGKPSGLSGQQLASLSAMGLIMLDWYPRYRYRAAAGFSPLGILISLAALVLIVMTARLSPKASRGPDIDPAAAALYGRSPMSDNSLPGR